MDQGEHIQKVEPRFAFRGFNITFKKKKSLINGSIHSC